MLPDSNEMYLCMLIEYGFHKADAVCRHADLKIYTRNYGRYTIIRK